MNISPINTPELILGEGVVWNNYNNSLLFVDIEKGIVYNYFPTNDTLKSYNISGRTGFLVVVDAENIIVAKDNTLITLNLITGETGDYSSFGLENHLRFNDGKCDKSGRIWADVMVIDGSSEKFNNGGCLMCIENKKSVFRIDNMTIPNGMDWLGDKYYHTDTTTKKIIEYNTNGNSISFNRVAVDLSEEQGSPDGFCIDKNGNIWVAMWGGFCVLCCNPKTGEIISRIEIPSENVSCCTFGGENSDTLYVISAQDDNGNSGKLYSVDL